MAVEQKKINWQLVIAAVTLLIAIAYNFAHANYVNGQNEKVIEQMQRDIQEMQTYRNQDQKANDKVDVRLDQLQLDAAILKQRFDDFKK